MKIQLELVVNKDPDGRVFLNYWDCIKGDDVCCQIIDNKLFKFEYDPDTSIESNREISLSEFIKLVENCVNERTKTR